jgi:preprotein translocase subunit SecG
MPVLANHTDNSVSLGKGMARVAKNILPCTAADTSPESPEKGRKAANPMQILLYFVVVIHVLVCLFLIGVVLLQQGRSADLAGAFGGQGSQTAFGPRAAANVLTRLTTWSAIIFMITSISLTVLYDRTTASRSVLHGIKAAPVSSPAKPGK